MKDWNTNAIFAFHCTVGCVKLGGRWIGGRKGRVAVVVVVDADLPAVRQICRQQLLSFDDDDDDDEVPFAKATATTGIRFSLCGPR